MHCIEEACWSYHLLPFVNAFTNCSLVLYNVSCKCGWKLDDYRALLWNEKDYFWTLCCKTSLEKTIGNVITFLLEWKIQEAIRWSLTNGKVGLNQGIVHFQTLKESNNPIMNKCCSIQNKDYLVTMKWLRNYIWNIVFCKSNDTLYCPNQRKIFSSSNLMYMNVFKYTFTCRH